MLVLVSFVARVIIICLCVCVFVFCEYVFCDVYEVWLFFGVYF